MNSWSCSNLRALLIGESCKQTGHKTILTILFDDRHLVRLSRHGLYGLKRFSPQIIVYVGCSPQDGNLVLEIDGKRQWVVLRQLQILDIFFEVFHEIRLQERVKTCVYLHELIVQLQCVLGTSIRPFMDCQHFGLLVQDVVASQKITLLHETNRLCSLIEKTSNHLRIIVDSL